MSIQEMDMKTMKWLVTLLTVLVAGVDSKAQFVSEQKAQERVREFVVESLPALARGDAEGQIALTLAYTEWDEDSKTPAVYVFNRTDGGFIVASADERVTPVLGYAYTGEWVTENISEAQRALLADYGKEVSEARKSTDANVRRAKTYDDTWEMVEPLIKTQWGQNAPYNNLCPMKNLRRCITGCVATAFAQIMYYHRWPERGTGAYSYVKNGIECSADFGSTTYQWDKMKLKYKSTDPDEDDAVATLMYHCGVAHNMEYGINESYGYFNWWWEGDQQMSEIVKYFGYDAVVWGMYRSNVTELQFATTIYNNLKWGLPVLYNATNSNNSAHVYICDGYDGKGYFHINWGWDGNGDGNFLLTSMNTYNINRIILYNIMPPGYVPAAIHNTPAVVNGHEGIWDMRGQRITGGQQRKGLYIVKSADGKAKKIIR